MISTSIEDFDENECNLKYDQLQSEIIYTPWSKDEDDLLISLLENKNDINWYECSAIISVRTPYQCQKRWSIIIPDKNKVGNWGHREQVFIFKLMILYRFSWKKIVKFLPGRSQNSVKSFFHSTIRKIKKTELFLSLIHI